MLIESLLYSAGFFHESSLDLLRNSTEKAVLCMIFARLVFFYDLVLAKAIELSIMPHHRHGERRFSQGRIGKLFNNLTMQSVWALDNDTVKKILSVN
ncbi:hypothetical protein L4174_002955 [Photobacterium sp. CCB-ST2H9]|uniref:hypothetical protein n=1 Tax=Photobacterium sp. CCB-ST2H9 TaxID=2912855 RepID=UPI002002D943|nr:hypothetical protein [Photobacterium sp. CCB-ST2H9]UTM57853.1 hypothetical protein L4174_002955 [Photobacterium sp. CCB-ST2H9]